MGQNPQPEGRASCVEDVLGHRPIPQSLGFIQRPLWSKCSLVERLEPKEGTDSSEEPCGCETRPVPGWVGWLMEHGAGRQQDSGHCELREGWWELGFRAYGPG